MTSVSFSLTPFSDVKRKISIEIRKYNYRQFIETFEKNPLKQFLEKNS